MTTSLGILCRELWNERATKVPKSKITFETTTNHLFIRPATRLPSKRTSNRISHLGKESKKNRLLHFIIKTFFIKNGSLTFVLLQQLKIKFFLSTFIHSFKKGMQLCDYCNNWITLQSRPILTQCHSLCRPWRMGSESSLSLLTWRKATHLN